MVNNGILGVAKVGGKGGGICVDGTTYHSLFRFRPTMVEDERLFAFGSRPFCCNDRNCVRRNKISRSCSWSMMQICSSALLTGCLELSVSTVWAVWDMLTESAVGEGGGRGSWV